MSLLLQTEKTFSVNTLLCPPADRDNEPGDSFKRGFRTSFAKETVCDDPLHPLAKLRQAVLGTMASQRREMGRRRNFWTIFRQVQPDDVYKNAGRCMMAGQFRADMVNIALRQGGKLTPYG